MKKNIPVNTPLLSGNELKYVSECIETGWISSEGPFIKKFENQFSSYVNRNYGIAVSNGSAALDIVIKALGIGVGDEVIMPAFTIISPAQSIVTSGAIPVLVDSEIHSWNMNVFEIESKINTRTKAILVVHIYGLPVDMDPIISICEKYNLLLIEDAAEMHGQTYNGRMCGSFGDVSIFSFYPNKHITTGEGGMIVCDKIEIAEKCQKLRNLAFEPNGRRFIHNEIGWNYRMTNLQAAIGVAQLEKIDVHINLKRKNGLLYYELLKNRIDITLPLIETNFSNNIFWVFGLLLDSEDRLDKVVKALTEFGIGTRPFFWCMHEQPVFKNMGLFENQSFPIAEKIARTGFYLPSGLGISEEDIVFICEKLNKILDDIS
jgi:perosamine synthetase